MAVEAWQSGTRKEPVASSAASANNRQQIDNEMWLKTLQAARSDMLPLVKLTILMFYKPCVPTLEPKTLLVCIFSVLHDVNIFFNFENQEPKSCAQ